MISWIRHQLGGKKQGKIGFRLIAASILFSSILALAITILQFFQNYDRELSRIETNIQLIENVYFDNLSKVIWLMDEELIIAQLNSILSFPEIEQVSLIDDIKNKWTVGKLISSKKRSHLIDLTLMNNGKAKVVGHLTITIGLSQVYHNLFKEILILFAANITKAWLVAFVMLFLFKRMVTRHLDAMSKWVSQFDITLPQTNLKLPGQIIDHNIDPKGNEILQLFKGIYKLSHSLTQSWNNLDGEYRQQGIKLDDALALMHKEINERELAQDKLQIANIELNDNNQKLDEMMVVMNRHVMSIQVNHSGVITGVSDAFCSVFGYSNKECSNQPLVIILKSESDQNINQLFLDKKNDFGIYENKLLTLKKNGEEIWVHITIIKKVIHNLSYQVFLDDITNQKRAEALSTTDSLTGLKNKRSFDHFFNALCIEAKTHNKFLLFSLMDIDHFKEFNDTYGHLEGDNCLSNVAAVLSDGMRAYSDHAFRVGGEEFAILCFITSNNDALPILEKLCSDIEDLKIQHTNNQVSEYVTASFGGIIIDNNQSYSLTELYALADCALYDAKSNGRNNVVMKEIK